MPKDEIEVDKFKELIKDMYKGFPNWRYAPKLPNGEGVEGIVTIKEVRDKLEKSGILIKSPTVVEGKEFKWMLGPNALPLVSAWKTEELAEQSLKQSNEILELSRRTKKLNRYIVHLTKILLIVGGLTILVGIGQILAGLL